MLTYCLSQLINSGLEVEFGKDGCKIIKEGVVVGTTGQGNPLYKLNQPDEAFSVWQGDSSENPEGIKTLVTKNLGVGISIKDGESKESCYESCIQGKMTQQLPVYPNLQAMYHLQ